MEWVNSTAQHVDPEMRDLGVVCALGWRACCSLCLSCPLNAVFSTRALLGACRRVLCNIETILFLLKAGRYRLSPVHGLGVCLLSCIELLLEISFLFTHFEYWKLFLYVRANTFTSCFFPNSWQMALNCYWTFCFKASARRDCKVRLILKFQNCHIWPVIF